MLPWHYGPSSFGVLADMLGQVAVFLNEVPERLLVLVVCERHVIELLTGRYIQQYVSTAVTGYIAHRVGVARI